MIKRFLKALLGIIFVALLVVHFHSAPYHKYEGSLAPRIGSVKVSLSSGKYNANIQELVAVLKSGDVKKLDYFTNLSAADLRGSKCFDEIVSWADAHPDIRVLYDMCLPDGSVISTQDKSVNISALDRNQLDRAVQLLQRVRSLDSIDISDSNFTKDDIAMLKAAFPDTQLIYNATLMGKNLDMSASSLDLSDLTKDHVQDALDVLPMLTNLSHIDFGHEGQTDLSLDDIVKVAAACPGAEISYDFNLYGVDMSFDSTDIDLRNVPVNDEGAAIRALVPFMKNLKTLDMDSCGVSNANMQLIRDAAPNVKVIWRVWFGDDVTINSNGMEYNVKMYSVRTDTERILASKISVGGELYDDVGDVLKYCTAVKYLDLGHNDFLSDISFVRSMPELEVLIIAMTSVVDISPLAACPKLEYLEVFSNDITDLSPLANSTALRHLNIANCPGLTDISPLYNLTELERLWIGSPNAFEVNPDEWYYGTPIPVEQVEMMQQCAPNCEINTEVSDPTTGSWRFYAYDPEEPKYYWVDRHLLLRSQLGYDYQEYSFYWLDPLCDLPAPAQYAGMFGREVYQ